MRGLIYKDFFLFFKHIDKKTALFAGAAVILLMFQSAPYGGMLASVMFAMLVGIQNITVFTADEKTDWKKYQLALPVSSFRVVACKYAAVVCTIGISLLGSIGCNLVTGILYRQFTPAVFGISMAAAVIIPLFWTAVCMPATYWFGTHCAQIVGIIMVFPVFYLVRYFEDRAGFRAVLSLSSYVLGAAAAAAILFVISLFISTAGYSRKK